jgi:hypothetical protein
MLCYYLHAEPPILCLPPLSCSSSLAASPAGSPFSFSGGSRPSLVSELANGSVPRPIRTSVSGRRTLMVLVQAASRFSAMCCAKPLISGPCPL